MVAVRVIIGEPGRQQTRIGATAKGRFSGYACVGGSVAKLRIEGTRVSIWQ